MANEVATINKSRELADYFSSEGTVKKFAALMTPPQTERFIRLVSNAILKDPALAEVDKTTLFLECQKAAADGLVLDGREAVLTTFNTNRRIKEGNQWVDNWVKEVVYIPMIKGLRKLVSQAPQVASWNTGLVYDREIEEDRFSFTKEPPSITHRPIFAGETGPVVAAYSVVRLKGGEILIDVMSRGKLDAIMNRTKSRKRGANRNEPGEITGPWATDRDEMYIKTVARHHFKSIPLGDKFEEAFNRVDSLYDMGGNVLDVEPEEPKPQPRAVANKKDGGAAAKLAAAAAAKPKPAAKPAQESRREADDDGVVIEHDDQPQDDPPQDQRDGYNPEDDF